MLPVFAFISEVTSYSRAAKRVCVADFLHAGLARDVGGRVFPGLLYEKRGVKLLYERKGCPMVGGNLKPISSRSHAKLRHPYLYRLLNLCSSCLEHVLYATNSLRLPQADRTQVLLSHYCCKWYHTTLFLPFQLHTSRLIPPADPLLPPLAESGS